MADEEYTRVHITPFNPSLLNVILPASILPNARNISYHEVQTFPEKSYGYVDLPVMDAEKMKKKLNGSILKGTKVKIDKARPQKEMVVEAPTEEVERPKREKKKRKRDEIPGVDIGERNVKRGWTVPAKDVPKTTAKDKKTVNKSKFTTGPECLFKTVLPPNIASKSTGKVAEVKSNDKRKKKRGKEAVVHEFTKTTKYATFLRSSSGSSKSKEVSEFVEGKGWVDEDGNVIEAVAKSRRTKEPIHKSSTQAPVKQTAIPAEAESSSSSSDESERMDLDVQPDIMADNKDADDNPSEEDVDEKDEISTTPTNIMADPEISSDSSPDDGEAISSQPISIVQKADSSRGESSDDQEADQLTADLLFVQLGKQAPSESESSDDSGSEASSSSEEESDVDEPASAVTSRPQSSAGPALTIKIPDSNNSAPIASSVHPLEALYKRSKVDGPELPKPAASSFSFFGRDNDEDADIELETTLQVPLTPFTQKDFEYRGTRSAAPTPDTAHPNKRFIWPENDEDEDDDSQHASSPIRQKEQVTEKESKRGEDESEFQKWFWENRGNVNRAWKKRKRTVAKETRQRESRKRYDRAV